MSEVFDIAPLRTSCNSREFRETIDELCAKLRGSDVPEESWVAFLLQDDMEVIRLLSNAFLEGIDLKCLSRIITCICLLSCAAPTECFAYFSRSNATVLKLVPLLPKVLKYAENELASWLYFVQHTVSCCANPDDLEPIFTALLAVLDTDLDAEVVDILVLLLRIHINWDHVWHRAHEGLNEPQVKGSGAAPTVLRRCAEQHPKAGEFSHAFCRYFNREDQADLCVKFLTETFLNAEIDTIFYPNDVAVIVDIVLRYLEDAIFHSDHIHKLLLCLRALIVWPGFSGLRKGERVRLLLCELRDEAEESGGKDSQALQLIHEMINLVLALQTSDSTSR